MPLHPLAPNGQTTHLPTLQSTPELAVTPILNTREVAQTLHHLMQEVTREAITPETVKAACLCSGQLVELMRVCIEAARVTRQGAPRG
jgi:hypothetical protein